MSPIRQPKPQCLFLRPCLCVQHPDKPLTEGCRAILLRQTPDQSRRCAAASRHSAAGVAKMGRKPTPQPLILADGSPLDDHDPPQLSAEGASQAAASPIEAKSPKSQRTSPFPISKFAVHRNRPSRTTGRSPTLQPQPPRPATSTGPPDEATRQLQQRQLQQYRAQARDDSDLLQPSSMSTLEPHSAGLPPQHMRQAMMDGNKSAKPSFFQFNKVPKTPIHPQAAQAQQHPESRGPPMSRGSDGGDKSGYKGKARKQECRRNIVRRRHPLVFV